MDTPPTSSCAGPAPEGSTKSMGPSNASTNNVMRANDAGGAVDSCDDVGGCSLLSPTRSIATQPCFAPLRTVRVAAYGRSSKRVFPAQNLTTVVPWSVRRTVSGVWAPKDPWWILFSMICLQDLDCFGPTCCVTAGDSVCLLQTTRKCPSLKWFHQLSSGVQVRIIVWTRLGTGTLCLEMIRPRRIS